MIIESITFKDGFLEKKIEFSKNFSLVFSSVNSVGKTTLLRGILYSLGYSIPSTKKFDFEKIEVELNVVLDDGSKKKINRQNRNLFIDDDFFSLPANQLQIQSSLFGLKKELLVKNLLGAFYVDQEKGWTLLNRGSAIGREHFNIHEFVMAVSEKDDDSIIKDLKMVNKAIAKYKKLENIVEYQRDLNTQNNFIYRDNHSELNQKVNALEYEKKILEKDLRCLKQGLKENSQLLEFIKDMRLRIKNADGQMILVQQNNIVGFNENQEFIRARIHQLEDSITALTNKIASASSQIERVKSDNKLIEVETKEVEFDRQISNLKISPDVVHNALKNFREQKKELLKLLDAKIKTNNNTIDELHSIISSYARELDVDEKYVPANSDYIFTNKLASLSGAILHKIVFCFKMAYIKIIEKRFNCLLPIILDSPNGKEVSKENVCKMMDVLKRDFSNHQIIVASIYDYNYADKKIELKKQLMEN